MDFSGSPAALGGLIMCVALAAWILGRWQGSGFSADLARDRASDARLSLQDHAPLPQSAPPPTIPCQQVARAERRGVLDGALSLGDLHAEVSAYRRTQQVLADFVGEQRDLPEPRIGMQAECRYVGLTGQPTCAMPAAVRRACVEEDGCSSRLRAVQPSACGSDFTRV